MSADPAQLVDHLGDERHVHDERRELAEQVRIVAVLAQGRGQPRRATDAEIPVRDPLGDVLQVAVARQHDTG